VQFTLDGKAVEMAAGECWYLNLNLPHKAANRSSQRRIHLVVDCVVNGWLRRLIENSASRQEKGE
jgi:mannose-6-phosphate isomerase-like protein (cupin superfamily)